MNNHQTTNLSNIENPSGGFNRNWLFEIFGGPINELILMHAFPGQVYDVGFARCTNQHFYK